jgi:hypothetical protein
MWASAGDALHHLPVAIVVAVSLLGAPGASLVVFALEGLVAYLLTVVALLRAWPSFKYAGIS